MLFLLHICMSFNLLVQKSKDIQEQTANVQTAAVGEEIPDKPLKQSHSSLSWGLSSFSLNPSGVETDLKYLDGSVRKWA